MSANAFQVRTISFKSYTQKQENILSDTVSYSILFFVVEESSLYDFDVQKRGRTSEEKAILAESSDLSGLDISVHLNDKTVTLGGLVLYEIPEKF